MKKIVLVLLLCLMLPLILAACDGGDGTPEGTEYVFSAGNVKIAIDADAAPILSSLGAWKAYDESPSCAFEGLDKVYTYSGFEIQTYPDGDRDFIYLVELYDDTVEGPRGIRVGSTSEEVASALGAADRQSGTAWIYDGNGMYLELLIRDGAVNKIRYCRAD